MIAAPFNVCFDVGSDNDHLSHSIYENQFGYDLVDDF